MLDWVSSEAFVGMELGECLLNTVPLLIALPFFNLGEQNALRLDKFGISRFHSTWTFTILSWILCPVKLWLEWNGVNTYRTLPLLIALPFFNLGEQNELRLDKFGISRLHSTWTFTI